MTMQPVDLRDCAKPLAKSAIEFERRTSVRAAYYAAYHQMCPLHKMVKGLDHIKHRMVVSFLYSLEHIRDARFPKLAVAVGKDAKLNAKMYQMCKEERERADYFLDSDIESNDALMQLMRVSQLFAYSTKIHSELTR